MQNVPNPNFYPCDPIAYNPKINRKHRLSRVTRIYMTLIQMNDNPKVLVLELIISDDWITQNRGEPDLYNNPNLNHTRNYCNRTRVISTQYLNQTES